MPTTAEAFRVRPQDLVGAIATEALSNYRTITAYGLQRRTVGSFETALRAPHSLNVKNAWVSGVGLAVSQFFMIGIYAVVANANHMPLHGGAENLLGTNPIAFAIPAGEQPPVVLDIATTVVSYGTVKAYKLQGKTMPEGWMVNPKDGSGASEACG